MVIDWTGSRFEARCTFDERLILRRNFWRWDAAAKRFWTDDIKRVVVLRNFATTEALARVRSYEANAAAKTSASFAVDSEIEIPTPSGIDPVTGKPFAYLGYQKAGIAYALERRDTLIADEPGLGKGHPYTTRILTPTGWRFCGDLRAGDLVIGSTGKPTQITAIFERGVKEVFSVMTDDGCSVAVDGDHLWFAEVPGEREPRICDTHEVAQLIESGRPPAIPLLIDPPQCRPVDAEVDPFVDALRFAKPKHLGETDVPRRPAARWSEGSIEQRMRFLSGIVRGVGVKAHKGTHLMVPLRAPAKNRPWFEEITGTIRSLGGLAHVLRWHPVTGAHIAVFLPENLHEAVIGRQRNWTSRFTGIEHVIPHRRLVSVRRRGREDVRCLQVAAADQLYVVEDHIVTHNTIQAIGFTNTLPECTDVLVIAPATLKVNWQREFEKWTTRGLTVGIAHTRQRQETAKNADGIKVTRKFRENVFPDTNVVVINYELLPLFHDAIRLRRWAVLTVDEAHALQNEDSERARQILGGKKKRAWKGRPAKPQVTPIRAVRRLFLSGTPMTKRPRDLWPLIRTMDPHGLGADWFKYAYRYCEGHEGYNGFDADGASNLEELQDYLRRTFMVRRQKDQVLTDLPPKTRQIIELPAEGLSRQIKAEKDAFEAALLGFERELGLEVSQDLHATQMEALLADIGDKLDTLAWEDYADGPLRGHLAAIHEVDRARRSERAALKRAAEESGASAGELAKMQAEAMTALATARMDLALGALPMRTEIVRGLLDAGEKVILFAHHKDVIQALLDTFPGSAHISGLVPTHRRQAQVDRFQQDESCRTFVGQFKAAGTGSTLTRGRIVSMMELVWTPADLEQAEDRAHRLTQLHNVLVQYMPVAGSLDCKMLGRIIERMAIIRQAINLAA